MADSKKKIKNHFFKVEVGCKGGEIQSNSDCRDVYKRDLGHCAVFSYVLHSVCWGLWYLLLLMTPGECYLFGCELSLKNGRVNQKISFHDFSNRDKLAKMFKLWKCGRKINHFQLSKNGLIIGQFLKKEALKTLLC
jgi:hypothetical protein